MATATEHEYMCPHCGHINAIAHHELRNKYTEQYAKCDKCHTGLEIVPADGINEQVNLVVSEIPQDALLR